MQPSLSPLSCLRILSLTTQQQKTSSNVEISVGESQAELGLDGLQDGASLVQVRVIVPAGLRIEADTSYIIEVGEEREKKKKMRGHSDLHHSLRGHQTRDKSLRSARQGGWSKGHSSRSQGASKKHCINKTKKKKRVSQGESLNQTGLGVERAFSISSSTSVQFRSWSWAVYASQGAAADNKRGCFFCPFLLFLTTGEHS